MQPMFDLLPHIDPHRPESWEGKRFLSFDIDWAHDDVLADTIAMVEQAGIPATWFVTHDTPLLAVLRANPKFALGIHPNFNELLNGSPRAGADAGAILDALMQIVPEAKVIRSHSLAQSERMVDAFHARGLSHISNFFIPAESGPLRPWHVWDGMVCIPHGWQDNVSMRMHGRMQPPQWQGGVQVYDFHPIHVFLNSENVARYESARADFRDPAALLSHRGTDANGARFTLQRVMEGA